MNPSLRVIIVDDERPARKWMRELLTAHTNIKIVGEADGVESAITLARESNPDVVFLDVQMPPESGFNLLPHLAPSTRVVFVTAYDTFAVKAFEANARDYLLKPVNPERLAETVRRLGIKEAPLEAEPTTRLQPDDIVPLQDRGQLHMVPVRRIAAIVAEGSYSRVLLCGQKDMLLLKRMKEWDERLPAPTFARIDRSLLINLELIRSVQVRNRNETTVALAEVAEPLVLGRSASVRLRKLLQEHAAATGNAPEKGLG